MQRQLWLSCFTAKFFHDADAAVVDYVAGVLSDAAGDGSTAAEAASAVDDFRAADIPPAEFRQALVELLAALRDPAGPGGPPPGSWDSEGSSGEGRGSSGTGTKGGAAILRPPDPPPQAGSSLSAHAPAFQPALPASSLGAATAAVGSAGEGAGGAAALPEALHGLALNDPQQWGEGYAGEAWENGECAEGDGGWGHSNALLAAGCEGAEGAHAPQLQWYPRVSDSSGGWPLGWEEEQELGAGRPLPASQDQPHYLMAGSADSAGVRQAFLSVLGQQFPEYSPASLEELLDQQGGCLEATAEVLCSLERELQGQVTLAGAFGSPLQEASGPSFGDSDFPSLSAAGPSSPSTQRPAKAAGASYYTAAVRPAEGDGTGRAAPRTIPLAARPGSASHSRRQQGGQPPGKSPIWESRGVPQFATGAQAAAEYAAAREEARDHARLRNAYFQQATQAYLAGSRALAKELGAKGRWHGQQMQAAHSAAAERIFAQRNPGALSPAMAGAAAACRRSGNGGGGSGRVDGVPTIDLHGLHVSEALERLEGLLLSLLAGSSGSISSGSRRLRIVVGMGQHGKVPARLPAAVRHYLQGQGLAFSEPYAGLLEVQFS